MCSITDALFTEKGIEVLNLGGFRSDRKTGFRRKQWVSWIESLSVAAKSFLGVTKWITKHSLDTFLPMSFANAAKHKIFIAFVMSVTNCYNEKCCVICQDFFFTLFNYLPLIKNLCLFENLTKTEQLKKL